MLYEVITDFFEFTVMQINIETCEFKSFDFKTRSLYCEIVPLGSDNLLIKYFDDLVFDDNSLRQDVYYDIMDLSTGKVTNFYFHPLCGGGCGDGSHTPDLSYNFV